MYRDPLPHPALREGKISRLISLANRAMAIAQLTQLRIAIPSSGNAPGEVPIDCFPMTDDVDRTKVTKRVSFATEGQMLTVPIETTIAEAEGTSTVKARVTDSREVSPVPPPGFGPFALPQAEWIKNGELKRDPGLKFVASWSAKIAEEGMSSPPPLEPLLPIPIETSQDSMTVQVSTTDSEAVTPIVLDRIRSAHRRRSRRPTKLPSTYVTPAPVEEFLFRDILCEESQIGKRSVSIPTGNKDHGTVPRWRLAWEGPFPNERSHASLRVLGKGCAFRHIKPSPLSGMAGGSGLGLVIRESWTLVRHVIQRSGYDGGNATTQRRMSHANELRHFGPVHVGTTRNGVETITKDNWRRSIPGSRSVGRGTRDARTTSFGPNGGIGTMETFIGPIAVRDSTILKTARVVNL